MSGAPEEAVEVAANAIYAHAEVTQHGENLLCDECAEFIDGGDTNNDGVTHQARMAIADAYPIIRAQVAEEIAQALIARQDAMLTGRLDNRSEGWINGLGNAVSIARNLAREVTR